MERLVIQKRYRTPKNGLRGNDIVSLHPEWQVAYQPGMMKKQIALIDSAFFDILLQQKVRQVGLSETQDASLNFTTRFCD